MVEKVIEGNCYCPSPSRKEDGKCAICGGNNPKIEEQKPKRKSKASK